MGYKGSLVGYLLRIITPEEINELITTVDEGLKRPLTELIEESQGESLRENPKKQDSGTPGETNTEAKGDIKQAIASYRKSMAPGSTAQRGDGENTGEEVKQVGVLVNKKQS